MKKWLISIFMLAVAGISHASPLSPEGYLNKLSHSLRGIAPMSAEYDELRTAVEKGNTDRFFALKRMQYIGSSMFAEKMRWRVTEQLKLRPVDVALLTNKLFAGKKDERANASDDLLFRMFSQNLPWDYMLTGNEYNLHLIGEDSDEVDTGTIDFEFFNRVLPQDFQQNLNSKKEFKLLVSPNDERFAGILTSPRFFNRYATTGVNKNRKRAAAIFRTFLCDDMLAAVPDPSSNEDKIIELQLPPNAEPQFTENEIRAAQKMGDSAHGNQADCRSCHYKLDPMGKVFMGSSGQLSNRPWPGALSYKNSQGNLVNIPVSGVRKLGEAIIQQEDYVTCQINHFWKWFVGNDVPLTSTQMINLKKEFERVGRRTGDFVNVIVQLPEFKNRVVESPEQKNSRYTKQIFQKCQSCHSGQTDDVTGEPLIDLTLWPLGQNTSQKDPAFWMKRISVMLDLEHGGLNRKMPPPSRGWSLTREDLLTIQAWIKSQEGKK